MSVPKYFLQVVSTKIFLIFFLIISTTDAIAQGGWDIKYIPLNLLNSESIDKEVRIDFKTSITDSLRGEVKVLDIRKVLSNEDTVKLALGGEFVMFKESWKIYIDQGILVDQTLERLGNTDDERTYIREMFLVSINETTLTIDVVVHSPSGKNRETIIVNKSDIRGLLIRI